MAFVPYSPRRPDAKMLKSLSLDQGSPEQWTIPYLKRALVRYKLFLNLLDKVDSDTILVPTLEVEALWVTHMLRPGRYRSDCLRAWGAVLDHRIRATSSQNATDFQLALERTKKLWLDTYGFPYLEDSPKKVIKSKVIKSKEIDIRFERTIPFSNKKMYVVQSYHVFMFQ